MAKYLGEWTSYEDMVSSWSGADGVRPEEVLVAGYNAESYEGSAVCIFIRDGVLYDAYESHCSCNGLDEFTPTRTSLEALRTYDFYGSKEINDAVRGITLPEE